MCVFNNEMLTVFIADSEKSGKESPEGSNEELSPGDLISDQPTSK